jgi:filamentous hemagglutinin family protein
MFTSMVYAADIVTDGKTATTVNTSGNKTTITTGTIDGDNAFNSFEKFNVAEGDELDLYLPDGTINLINLVHKERSEINGILNSINDGKIGGNVFFLNPHGILVGKSGEINVGSLSLLTPTTVFMNNFFTADHQPSADAVRAVLEGTVPISAGGLVTVKGRIEANNDIRINAGKVEIGDIVNTDGMESEPEIIVKGNGDIVIQAKSSVDFTEIDEDEYKADEGIKSDSSIQIKGATLKAGNISLLANAVATFDWEPSKPLQLLEGVLPAGIDELTGEEAVLSIVSAAAGIDIGSGSVLTASGQVKLEAAANTVLQWKSDTGNEAVSVGLLYSKLNTDSTVTVGSGAKITAGSLDVSARNDSILEVKSLAHTDNKDSIAQ